MLEPGTEDAAVAIAQRFCASRGAGWAVGVQLGKGGTAPVFEIQTPEGVRALKIYDADFSSGQKGEIEEKRIEQQVALRGHRCESLVQVYDGGRFEGRLFLVMSRAPGAELEKHLDEVPRDGIRPIVHQVAQAAIFLRSNNLCHRDIKAANVFVSPDFSRTTLLDISVIRNVHDPIGVGTDHDGMLPVLATARYSPPEYLFRLLQPGPELWHALSVYQLGGLLHDLIMRRPLFQDEYDKSASNRYRFAWIVATTVPRVEAGDVDRDLVLLATRALDKDWERRSAIALEDFLLGASGARRKQALATLGLRSAPVRREETLAARLERVAHVASALEQSLMQYFSSNGVTVLHATQPGPSDAAKTVAFAWDVEAGNAGEAGHNELVVRLELIRLANASCFSVDCDLRCELEGSTYARNLRLPELPDGSDVDAQMCRQVEAAFERLAEEVLQPDARLPEA